MVFELTVENGLEKILLYAAGAMPHHDSEGQFQTDIYQVRNGY